MAKAPTPQFIKEIDLVFPEQLFGSGIRKKVIDELASGEITDNVKFYGFNTLLDFSPRTLSEMPEQYLRSGNGRIFYMLKTWTLKQFDIYRNEIFDVMKTDKVQGVKNMIRLATFLFIMNATADTIKDTITGREIKWDDVLVDNIAKLVGFSRYQTQQVMKEGLATTLTDQLAPPLPFLDDLSKDVVNLFKDFDKSADINELRSIRDIPVGGDLYYWWFGKGRGKGGVAPATGKGGLIDLDLNLDLNLDLDLGNLGL